jgi:hypothetical protein
MRETRKVKKQRKQSSDVLEATCARNIKDTFYHPALLVENNAVVHGIFRIAEDLTDKEILEETDKIVDRLHERSTMLAGFAARFIAQIAPGRLSGEGTVKKFMVEAR